MLHEKNEKYIRNILVGKPERKRALGRPERRWKYIKPDIYELGRASVVDWIQLAQNRV
jgi:hypothetical protein